MRYLLFLIAAASAAAMAPPNIGSNYDRDPRSLEQNDESSTDQQRFPVEGDVTPPTTPSEAASDIETKSKETADQGQGNTNEENSTPQIAQDGQVSYGSNLEQQNEETRQSLVPVKIGQNLAQSQYAGQGLSVKSGTSQTIQPSTLNTEDRLFGGYPGQPFSRSLQTQKSNAPQGTEGKSPGSLPESEASESASIKNQQASTIPFQPISSNYINQTNDSAQSPNFAEPVPNPVNNFAGQTEVPRTSFEASVTQSTLLDQEPENLRTVEQDQLKKGPEFILSGLVTVPSTTLSYNSDRLFPHFVSSVEDEKAEPTYSHAATISPNSVSLESPDVQTFTANSEARLDDSREASTAPAQKTVKLTTAVPRYPGPNIVWPSDVVKVYGEANPLLATEAMLDVNPRIIKLGSLQNPRLSEQPTESTDSVLNANSIEIVKRTGSSAKNDTEDAAAVESTTGAAETSVSPGAEESSTAGAAENADDKTETVTQPAEEKTNKVAVAAFATTNETEATVDSESTTEAPAEGTTAAAAEEMSTKEPATDSKVSMNAMIVSGNIKKPSKIDEKKSESTVSTSQPEVADVKLQEMVPTAEALVATTPATEGDETTNTTNASISGKSESTSPKEISGSDSGSSKAALTSEAKQEVAIIETNTTIAKEKVDEGTTEAPSDEKTSSEESDKAPDGSSEAKATNGSSGGVVETGPTSGSKNAAAKKTSQAVALSAGTDQEKESPEKLEASGQEPEASTPNGIEETGSGEAILAVELTTPEQVAGTSAPIKAEKRTDIEPGSIMMVEGTVKSPGTPGFGFAIEEPSISSIKDVAAKGIHGTSQEGANVLPSQSTRRRGFSSLPVKKIGGTTRRQWRPYRMDCSTEEDDKGELCIEWARSGLCLTHKPTMFLFCRKTCLCTGPPEY